MLDTSEDLASYFGERNVDVWFHIGQYDRDITDVGLRVFLIDTLPR